MALESFYGGKQGVSPVIKARFKYINEDDLAYIGRKESTTKLTKEEAIWLNDAFYKTNQKNKYKAWEVGEEINDTYISAEGSTSEKLINAVKWTPELLKPFTMDDCLKDVNYTDVWYGELCIIDTDNKMNPNNGKLYRRTLKQVDNKFANTEDTLYAEYIGQIVGPSGGIPNFDFGSLDDERQKAVGEKPTYDLEESPLDNSNWDYAYKNTEGKITSAIPNTYTDIAISQAGTPTLSNSANIQMVPGKNGSNYNDTIKYTWCNVQRKVDGENNDAWIYLGFEIPYVVYDVTGTEENYTYNGNIFIDTSDTQDGNNEHPFSKRYEFHIPRGTRGIGPEELFVVGKDNHNKPETLYDFDAITYDQTTDTYSVDENKTKTPTDLTYWVAKWRLYNPKTTNITNVYQYISAYKDISGVQLLNDGRLQIQYSNSDSWNTLNILTWITSATASLDNNSDNTTYGDFNLDVKFNNNKIPEINIDENLHLIKDMVYTDATGKIKFDYSGGVSKTVGTIKYVKEISVDTETNSNNYGKVKSTTNTKESNVIATLPLIIDNEYDPETGYITFTYAGLGELSTTKPIHDISDLVIKTPTNSVDLNSGETAITGHLYVKYKGEDIYKDLGLVKGNNVVGPVYTLVNTKSGSAGYFPTANNTTGGALSALSAAQFNENNPNSVGGNNDGRITSNGQDVTGGLVAAQIQETSDSDPYTALYYYNNNTSQWMLAGLVGEASSSLSGNSNVYIEIGDSIYPEENAINPQIYFTEDITLGSDEYTVNDFSPWLAPEVTTEENEP